jgi:hypothetical protein
MATQTTTKPSNFSANQWDKEAIPGGYKYTYKHICEDGKTLTITQKWKSNKSDEFIVGGMMALGHLYENASPEVHKIIQQKLSRGEEPYFAQIGTMEESEVKDQPVAHKIHGYIIAWPPDNSSNDPYFCFSKDELGNDYMLELDYKPADDITFLTELSDVFFNRSDRYRTSLFKRRTQKTNDAGSAAIKETTRGFVTNPDSRFNKGEGFTKGGTTSIQEEIKKLANILKTKPQSQISAQQISQSPTFAIKHVTNTPTVAEGGTPD